MTPDRLIINTIAELHREGISPNLENVGAEQTQAAAAKLLKLLGGLSETEQQQVKALPPSTTQTQAIVPPRQPAARSIESPTQMMPTIRPRQPPPRYQHPDQQPRYDWGQSSVDTAQAPRPEHLRSQLDY